MAASYAVPFRLPGGEALSRPAGGAMIDDPPARRSSTTGAIVVRSATELARGEATQTAGMTRAESPLAEEARAIAVRTQAGALSGWHHHADHATYGYVIEGRLRLESGPDGADVVEAGPGDVFHIPAHTVHREGNPGSTVQVIVGFRIGRGPTVVNVDGPT